MGIVYKGGPFVVAHICCPPNPGEYEYGTIWQCNTCNEYWENGRFEGCIKTFAPNRWLKISKRKAEKIIKGS